MSCSKMTDGAVPNLGEVFSMDGGEGNKSAKRPRGRPAKIGHFHNFAGPTHFGKVIMSPGLDLLPITDGFRPFIGTVPRTIVLKMNTECSWMVRPKDVNGRVTLDQGWHGFAIAHQLKFGHFLTFKILKGDVFNVTIFDYNMVEVVKKCPEHDPALAMIND